MSEVVYKGFRQDEMEYQYNPRVSVPEFPELSKLRAAQARKVRESAKSWLDVPYGNSPREKLDIYAADKVGGPVFVYLHGGYWRGGSKEDNCNFAPTLTVRGATVVLIEYDLCPQVTVSDIVGEIIPGFCPVLPERGLDLPDLRRLALARELLDGETPAVHRGLERARRGRRGVRGLVDAENEHEAVGGGLPLFEAGQVSVPCRALTRCLRRFLEARNLSAHRRPIPREHLGHGICIVVAEQRLLDDLEIGRRRIEGPEAAGYPPPGFIAGLIGIEIADEPRTNRRQVRLEAGQPQRFLHGRASLVGRSRIRRPGSLVLSVSRRGDARKEEDDRPGEGVAAGAPDTTEPALERGRRGRQGLTPSLSAVARSATLDTDSVIPFSRAMVTASRNGTMRRSKNSSSSEASGSAISCSPI